MRNLILSAIAFIGLGTSATPIFGINTYNFSNGYRFSYPDAWTRVERGANVRLFPEGREAAGLYSVSFTPGVTNPLDPRLDEHFELGLKAGGLKRIRSTEEPLLVDKTRAIRKWAVEGAGGLRAMALLGVSIVAGGNAMALFVIEEDSVFQSRRSELIALVHSMDEKKSAFKANLAHTAMLTAAPSPTSELTPVTQSGNIAGFEVLPPSQYYVSLRMESDRPQYLKRGEYYPERYHVQGYIKNFTDRHFETVHVYVDFTTRTGTVIGSTRLDAKNLKPGKEARLHYGNDPNAAKFVVTRVEVQ